MAIAPGHILDSQGPASNWAPATRTTNVHHYGRWLAYAQSQGLLEPDIGPAPRCTQDGVRTYIKYLQKDLAPETVVSSIIGLTVMMKAMVPEQEWHWLAGASSALKRTAKPSKDKRSRIRPSEEIYCAALENLRLLAKTELSEKRHVAAFRNALMLAILTACPIRRKNFSALRLGKSLTRLEDGWRIRFPAEEVKNKHPIDLQVPAGVIVYLDRYLQEIRPRLAAGRSCDRVWLNWYGQPLNGHAIYLLFVSYTRKLFGSAINPHLLRDCAASSMWPRSPSVALAAGHLLGHTNFRTTEKYYIHAKQIEAGRKVSQVLCELSEGT